MLNMIMGQMKPKSQALNIRPLLLYLAVPVAVLAMAEIKLGFFLGSRFIFVVTILGSVVIIITGLDHLGLLQRLRF